MTITVQAGMTLAELRTRLAAEKQRLPVDVPRAEQATLGGALATNASGPRRLGFGTLRDYVIGLTTINDEGQETKAGGRVVKNVAGYDLCKLHIGALGTLGIISQVTLKVRPLPETQALLTLGCESATLETLLDLIHCGRTRPVCVDLLNARAVQAIGAEGHIHLPEAPWVVVVGFEDSEKAVNWQIQQLIKEVAPTGIQGVEARAGGAGEPLWHALTEDLGSAEVAFKANLLPGKLASFCLEADRLADGILLHAHAGSGIVRGYLGGDLTLSRVQTILKELMNRVGAGKGNLIVPRCPGEWKRSLPIWGLPRDDVWLMRQVKEKLDPRRLFNPGRFVDGI
jgi:glycolate oxidase FAD binding subunit